MSARTLPLAAVLAALTAGAAGCPSVPRDPGAAAIEVASPAEGERITDRATALGIRFDVVRGDLDPTGLSVRLNGEDVTGEFDIFGDRATARLPFFAKLPLGENELVATVPTRRGARAVARRRFVNATGGFVSAALARDDAAPPPVLNIVLDLSGSMAEPLGAGGRARIAVAKEALRGLVGDVPREARVGLRVFQGSGDASDGGTRQVVPIGLRAVDRAAYVVALDGLKEDGGTPLIEGVLAGVRDFEEAPVPGRTLILVADGGGGSDEQVAAVKKAVAAAAVRLFVIGIAMGREGRLATLAALADETGGGYFEANDPEGLVRALQAAALRIPYVVRDRAGRVVARGLTGGERLRLPNGSYEVAVEAASLVVAVEVRPLEEARVVVDRVGGRPVADVLRLDLDGRPVAGAAGAASSGGDILDGLDGP